MCYTDSETDRISAKSRARAPLGDFEIYMDITLMGRVQLVILDPFSLQLACHNIDKNNKKVLVLQ